MPGMKKAMFNRFTHFLQQAVDVVSDSLTTNLPPQEEFVYHWKTLTCYFVDNKDAGVCIEETALPEHLSSMLRIIQEEDSSMEDSGTTGASLEYLLKNRILETLYTLGRTDYPSGMKQIVLSFFTKLLSRLSHPLLPHVNVHRAVQRMVKFCGETRAGPTEKEEIEFLCTVCAKIKTDPYLVNFFIEGVRLSPDKAEGQTDGETKTAANNKRLPAFSLVDALLALSHSEDARVSVKACEGLMLCASLPEPSAASTLVESTKFCDFISQRLCQLYDKLPTMVLSEDLEKVEAKWGFANIIDRNEQQTFQGKRYIISFLSWLDYCDQLIAVANPQVGKALARHIHDQLLKGKLLPHLMQLSETGAIVATTYLTRWLRTISSHTLLKEFSYFLLSENRCYEEQDMTDHALNKRLLERCNHVSEEVCVATLKLFDTLLQKEEEHIVHSLLLRNLLGRTYYVNDNNDPLSNSDMPNIGLEPETVINSSGDDGNKKPVEDSSNGIEKEKEDCTIQPDKRDGDKDILAVNDGVEKKKDEHDDDCTSAAKGIPDDTTSDSSSPFTSGSSSSPSVSSTPTSSLSSPRYGKSEVHKIVNGFMSLLPEEAKSSCDTVDGGYDMYLRDAQRQFSIQETICQPWDWPKRPVQLADYSMQPFYEGPFLHMLLDKLLHLLDQSYTINLLLTAIISKVALIPHPNLHEFLLDPFLTVPQGSRTLYSVLKKVSSEIGQHQKSDSTFSDKLLLARKQLLGLVPTIHRFEDQSRMEAIIVLEEFCKELSAITFVKHHAAVTRF